MYQLPVGNIEKIRKARKAVKNILSEIGLQDCQDYLKEVNENSEKTTDEEEAFEETEWVDITDGYDSKQTKKWPYRSRALCCNICKYSSQNIYNFRSHVSRCHGYVQSYCALTPCSQCLFISHPKVVKRHTFLFHPKLPVQNLQQQKESSGPVHSSDKRYQCRKCGYPSSSIFTMKKHIILKHLDNLAEQYIGYRLQQHQTTSVKVYCCKVCKVNTGNLDQMLHHMLMSHYSVGRQVQSLIYEPKNQAVKTTPNGNGLLVTFPSIAPKPQQPQIFNSNSLVLPGNGQSTGTVVTLQQVQGATNNATLICAPGTNQAFLPPQASALVQLASAEAKGLLQPGATIALRGGVPQGSSVIQLPTVSNVSLKQAPVTLSSTTQQSQQGHQIVLPSGQMASVAPGTVTASKPAVVTQNAPSNHIPLQGTMLTSQSLLSHLIPTGNKVNGMPTYTFAPLQPTLPVSQKTATPLKPVEQTSNSAPTTKKWITCPLCNELFPSTMFDMHTEVAHKTKTPTSKSESVAARASFLKKMPDKTVKCLICKVLLSEKSVFQHLLHGLNCLCCSALFFSIKQLSEHVKQHNPTSKAYCDFLRQRFRVYSKGSGGILFPYFDVNTTAPKEVLGDIEVNLALVTNALDLIFFKLQPTKPQEICPTPVKINRTFCPFCDEKFQSESNHLQHLKQKHFVAPTIHAILKTEAFKCIYCNGVYTGKVTQQAIVLHIQRCRCSPKPPQQSLAPKSTVILQPQAPKTVQQISQAPGLYFVQMPKGLTVAQTIGPARVIPAAKPAEPPETEAEKQSKKRLEAALKEVMMANKREREEKAAIRMKRDLEKREHVKLLQEKKSVQPEPEIQSDPTVKLALQPTQVERRGSDERRDFISKYFNLNPYASKSETEELCRRLNTSKAEVVALFSNKRIRCMKSFKRNTAAVLLGFNMTELNKVKHNLLIPEQQQAVDSIEIESDDSLELAEDSEPFKLPDKLEQIGNPKDDPEPMEESGARSIPEITNKCADENDIEPMDVSEADGDPDETEPME